MEQSMTTCSNWSGIKNVKLNYVRFFFILLTTRYGSVEHLTAWNKNDTFEEINLFFLDWGHEIYGALPNRMSEMIKRRIKET